MIIAGGNVFKGTIGQDRNSFVPISNFKIFGTTKYPQVSSALAVPKSNADIIYIAKNIRIEVDNLFKSTI